MVKKKFLPSKKTLGDKKSTSSIILCVCLIFYCLILFTPIVWSCVASFMTPDSFMNVFEYRDLSALREYTFDNFAYAWNNIEIIREGVSYKIGGLFLNSIIYSVGCAVMITLCPCIVGYAASRFKFKFSSVIYLFVIIAMALPIVGASASELKLLDALHLRSTTFSTFIAMFILRFNFMGINFLLFHAQFESIPKDYTESAKIDGASNFRIMTRVIVPQAKNTIITVFILSFIMYWNDFQIPFLYMPNTPTVSYAVYDISQSSTYFADVPRALAGIILLTLPIVILFILINRKIRVSVDMGGIK